MKGLLKEGGQGAEPRLGSGQNPSVNRDDVSDPKVLTSTGSQKEAERIGVLRELSPPKGL